MKLLHSWANEFVTMPKPERVREILDAAGLAVEEIVSTLPIPETVLVGSVHTIVPHPNADRLRVTKVDVGEARLRAIVCGADNVANGQKVAVALPGTHLPNGMVIEEASIRGITSEGMLCSRAELGLETQSSGIVVLPPKAQVGRAAGPFLGADTIYDVAVFPNRPDCLSVYGLCREVAAGLNRTVLPVPEGSRGQGPSPVALRIHDRTGCKFLSAQVMEGITVRASPSWLRERLAASGIRAINNVVDVTNYVMLELGQPLHAFDIARLRGNTIFARAVRDHETIRTLDGEVRTLTPGVLVLADAATALDVAGVMGGEASGVQQSTTSIVLTASLFAQQRVYNGARSLRMNTEASQRFSKGVDPAMIIPALERATALLVQLAGGRPVGAVVTAGTLPQPPKPVPVSLKRLNALLGTACNRPTAVQILRRLSMPVKGSGDVLLVHPPSFRHDLTLFEDVAEEIARLAGYNTIARTVPRAPGTPTQSDPLFALKETIADILARLGATEHVGYAYVPESMVTDPGRAVRILNPLSSEQAFLRTSLVPQLCALAAKNSRHSDAFRVFEFGKEYRRAADGFEEKEVLAGVVRGQQAFRVAKGLLAALLEHLCPDTAPVFSVQDRIISITLGGVALGTIEMPDAAVRQRLKVPADVAVWSLNQHALLEQLPPSPHPVFRQLSQFPAVKRDLAFWVKKGVPYAILEALVTGFHPLLTEVRLFDVFEQKDRKSIALHLTFRAADRTLTAAEADAVITALMVRLEKEAGAQIRR